MTASLAQPAGFGTAPFGTSPFGGYRTIVLAALEAESATAALDYQQVTATLADLTASATLQPTT